MKNTFPSLFYGTLTSERDTAAEQVDTADEAAEDDVAVGSH